jgi:hypothetical protein
MSAADSAVHLALINEERREGCCYHRRFRYDFSRSFVLRSRGELVSVIASTPLRTKLGKASLQCGTLSRFYIAHQFSYARFQFR